jgi:D-alanyl-lipoteichoic acid acyltransferase DltB (MBOAT superfamily)
MVPLLRLLVPFILFPASSAVVLRFAPASLKLKLFALINIFGALGLCILAPLSGLFFYQLKPCLEIALSAFTLYVLVVLAHFILTRVFAMRAGWAPWSAFLLPLAAMLIVKYIPAISAPFHRQLEFIDKKTIAEFFIGISYMAFRLSYLVLEVRNGVVAMPSIWEHLSYAFFVPTITVGPISRYSVFHQSLYKPDRAETPVGRSLLRILVGITKYLFLASMIEQLSYSGLLMDGHPHSVIDLPIAALAFFIYLYLNFSGYCDMAIGVAGLIGIRVEENFDSPFLSRNIQEFWTRWHITLTNFMRDTLFSPMSKGLIRRFGPKSAPHAIAVSIFTVFLAMGAWHGLTWNFIIYGSLHGAGVVSCHYYTNWLKKRLGKKGYAAYHQNRFIHAVAVTMTFTFAAGTLFFFANSLDRAREIMRILR